MRRYQRTPRFDDFRGMESNRDSIGCINGKDHEIKKGDWIGWSPKFTLVCCKTCWSTWTAENEEADRLERDFDPSGRW